MTDLRNEFSQLRADEIGRLRPPGADAVRETVRRRRRNRATGAALAVLLVAGGFAVGGRSGGTAPAGTPDAPYDPREVPVAMFDLAEQTIAAVGSGAEITRNSVDLSGPFTAEPPVTPGDYIVVGVCVGDGSVLVTGQASGLHSRLQVGCDPASPRPVEMPVTVGADGLELRVDADARSATHAAFTYKLTRADSSPLPGDHAAPARRRVIADATALATGTGTTVASTYGVSAPGGSVTGDGAAALGDHEFRITCSGAGSIAWRVKVAAGNSTTLVLQAGTARCSGSGTRTAFDVDSGGELQVELTPDAAAANAGTPWNYQIAHAA